jgi:hypothetical protein
MGNKPSVYLDTNIFSVLHARSGNIFSLAWQIKTREWWERERGFYTLYTSARSEAELLQGAFPGQEAALREARRISYLAETLAVRNCAKALIESSLVPASKPGDAAQLAFATVYRVDYLLTWNHAHLANVNVQRRLDEMSNSRKWRSPLLVSPETIPWSAFGHDVRRNDD